MAEEKPGDPDAANQVARVTFLWTMILAAGFIGSIVVFILLR